MKKIIVLILLFTLIFSGCEQKPVEGGLGEVAPNYPQISGELISQKTVPVYSLKVEKKELTLKKSNASVNVEEKTFANPDNNKVYDAQIEAVLKASAMKEKYEKLKFVAFVEYHNFVYAVYYENDEMKIVNGELEIAFITFCDRAYKYVVTVDPKPTGGNGLTQ